MRVRQKKTLRCARWRGNRCPRYIRLLFLVCYSFSMFIVRDSSSFGRAEGASWREAHSSQAVVIEGNVDGYRVVSHGCPRVRNCWYLRVFVLCSHEARAPHLFFLFFSFFRWWVAGRSSSHEEYRAYGYLTVAEEMIRRNSPEILCLHVLFAARSAGGPLVR